MGKRRYSNKEIISILSERNVLLQNKIYEIMLTHKIPSLTPKIRHRDSYKKFIKEFKRDNIEKLAEEGLTKINNHINKYNIPDGVTVTGRRYVRIAIFMDNIEELLNDICSCKEPYYELPNGFKVRTSSLNYNLYNKNLTCVKCGIKGRFLALERCFNDEGGDEGEFEGQGYHLNLYALDENGREILMTKDHIIPKSKGGPDILDNLQTMCLYCNEKKSDNIETHY